MQISSQFCQLIHKYTDQPDVEAVQVTKRDTQKEKQFLKSIKLFINFYFSL